MSKKQKQPQTIKEIEYRYLAKLTVAGASICAPCYIPLCALYNFSPSAWGVVVSTSTGVTLGAMAWAWLLGGEFKAVLAGNYGAQTRKGEVRGIFAQAEAEPPKKDKNSDIKLVNGKEVVFFNYVVRFPTIAKKMPSTSRSITTDKRDMGQAEPLFIVGDSTHPDKPPKQGQITRRILRVFINHAASLPLAQDRGKGLSFRNRKCSSSHYYVCLNTILSAQDVLGIELVGENIKQQRKWLVYRAGDTYKLVILAIRVMEAYNITFPDPLPLPRGMVTDSTDLATSSSGKQ